MASNDQLRFGQAFPGFGVANRLNPSGNGQYIYPDWQNAPLSQADAPSVAPPPASYPTWLTDLGSRGIGGDWTPTQGPAPDRYQLVSDFEASRPKPPPAPVMQAQQPQASAIPPGWDSAIQPYAHSSEAGGGGGGGGNTNDGVGNGGNTADAYGPGQGPSQNGLGAGGQSFGSLVSQLGDWLGLTSPPDPLSTTAPGGFFNGSPSADGLDQGFGNPDSSTAQDSGMRGDPAAAADINSQEMNSDPGGPGGPGSDPGGPGSDGPSADSNSEGNFRGGVITQNKLVGPNPPGPDDGYASIKKGEGVMTVKAMQHYGPAFLARLNKLAVPKSAAR